jgi:hypothetical protein
VAAEAIADRACFARMADVVERALLDTGCECRVPNTAWRSEYNSVWMLPDGTALDVTVGVYQPGQLRIPDAVPDVADRQIADPITTSGAGGKATRRKARAQLAGA